MNTPLPNKIKASSDIQLRHYIVADDGMYFAEIVYGTGEGSFECAKGRAGEIIHRWNAHDAMREALDELLGDVLNLASYSVKCRPSIEKARSALALASGTTEEGK